VIARIACLRRPTHQKLNSKFKVNRETFGLTLLHRASMQSQQVAKAVGTGRSTNTLLVDFSPRAVFTTPATGTSNSNQQ